MISKRFEDVYIDTRGKSFKFLIKEIRWYFQYYQYIFRIYISKKKEENIHLSFPWLIPWPATLATPFRPTMSTALQIYSFELYSCVPWWTAWFLTDSVMQMLASLRTQPRPDLNLKSPSFRASARTIEELAWEMGRASFGKGQREKESSVRQKVLENRGDVALKFFSQNYVQLSSFIRSLTSCLKIS